MRRFALLVAILAGCDDLQNFGGAAPPLVTIQLAANGSFPADAHAPKFAMLWATEWLTEPLCILPADSPEAATAIAAGCRDAFGFVPDRVGANVPLDPTTNGAELQLTSLPAADVMVGDVTARVAYASFVLYDDRDDSGTLELSAPHRLGGRDDMGPPDEEPPESRDTVYGASFVSMTATDRRLAFREGAFATTAFYPRAGCDAPLPAFSIVGAGGFTAQAAIAATLAGMLPQEDPAQCFVGPPDTSPVTVAVHTDPTELSAIREVACDERRNDSSIRFREPPVDAPDLTDRAAACTALASFGGSGSGSGSGAPMQQQFVISGKSTECKGLTHYVLRGCREDANCALPDWDISATPPAWWTCH